MSNSSVITIVCDDSPLDTISLYGHFMGDDNLTAVRNVLSRTRRIGDITYLTAQLFYEFSTMGAYDGELGFGIFAGIDGGYQDAPTVVVNASNGTYTIDGDPTVYDEFAKVAA